MMAPQTSVLSPLNGLMREQTATPSSKHSANSAAFTPCSDSDDSENGSPQVQLAICKAMVARGEAATIADAEELLALESVCAASAAATGNNRSKDDALTSAQLPDALDRMQIGMSTVCHTYSSPRPHLPAHLQACHALTAWDVLSLVAGGVGDARILQGAPGSRV